MGKIGFWKQSLMWEDNRSRTRAKGLGVCVCVCVCMCVCGMEVNSVLLFHRQMLLSGRAFASRFRVSDKSGALLFLPCLRIKMPLLKLIRVRMKI